MIAVIGAYLLFAYAGLKVALGCRDPFGKRLAVGLTVLVCGRIASLVDFPGVGELVVETTEEPGRMFGWSGLDAPGRATATVRADDDSRIMTVPLAPILHGPPAWKAVLCGMVAGVLADRTRELQVRWSAAADAREDPDDA